MAERSLSAKQMRENIFRIESLLRQHGPDYPDRQFYEQMLDEQYEELATLSSVQPSVQPSVQSSVQPSVRPNQPIQQATNTPLPALTGECSRSTDNLNSI